MSNTRAANSNTSTIRLAYFALVAICLIWGTTYGAIKIGIQYFPPFLMAALRQTGAGILLLSICFFRGRIVPIERSLMFKQALIGFAMLTGGNGLMTWAIQYIPTGLSAVVSALTPIAVLIISYLWKGGERITKPIVLGIFLGFVGMALIFHDGWAALLQEEYQHGMLACFGSLFAWSFGVVLAKRTSNDLPPMQSAGTQIFFGGLGLFVCSFIFEKTAVIQHDWRAYAALFYLLLFGSAIAYSLYMFVLKHLSATVSSLYAYINPIVAITIGWLFFAEKLTSIECIGMLITLVGVYVANSAYIVQKLKKK